MSQGETAMQQQDLVIERVFNAPRERVWQAWTDPEEVKKWWGPKDYTAPSIQTDLRVGGKNLWAMQSPQGEVFWTTGTYREIVPMERIVVTDSFADEDGNVVPGSHYGMGEDFPLEMLITVTFEDADGGTKLTIRHSGLPPTEAGQQAGAGWNESLDKLAAALS